MTVFPGSLIVHHTPSAPHIAISLSYEGGQLSDQFVSDPGAVLTKAGHFCSVTGCIIFANYLKPEKLFLQLYRVWDRVASLSFWNRSIVSGPLRDSVAHPSNTFKGVPSRDHLIYQQVEWRTLVLIMDLRTHSLT